MHVNSESPTTYTTLLRKNTKIPWNGILGNAPPPPPPLRDNITTVLEKVISAKPTILQIAPFWPWRPCFTKSCLTNLLIDHPRLLLVRLDMLGQRGTNAFHPEPQKLNLTLWPILGDILRRQGFQKGLQIMAVKFLRIGTMDTYDSLLHRFYKLCPESQTDPASASLGN